MPSVTHEVKQVHEFNQALLSEEEKNDVIECHKKPVAYITDDSFAAEMNCRVDECLANENSEMPGSFMLKRTLYFEFTWEDEGAMSEWEAHNTTTDDATLPS